MDKTINAKDVQPGMTITEKHGGITQTFTVHAVTQQEASVILRTAENDAVILRHFKEVTVLAEAEPDMGSVIMDADGFTWARTDADEIGWRVVNYIRGVEELAEVPTLYRSWEDQTSRGDVTVLYRNTYTPPSTSNTPENKVPEVVQSWTDWEHANAEWRKHKWEDKDGDVWEWFENHSKWYVVNRYGSVLHETGPNLIRATFPVTRVK